jgi:hypothetical protein
MLCYILRQKFSNCIFKKNLINSDKIKYSLLYKKLSYNFSNIKEVLSSKEKFSLSSVEEIINELVEKDHRDIERLPREFHKFSDVLITLEKAREPDDYECCVKGCNPCCWDIYDTKLRNYQEIIKTIHKIINENDDE